MGGLVGFDGAVVHELLRARTQLDAGFHPQFLHGLGQDLLVSLVTHVGDETALLGPQEVAGAADIQVLHGDVEAAAQVAELLDGVQPAAGLVGQGNQRRHDEVAERFLVASSHAAAELMQVTQADILRLVHDDRVGVGDVQAAFDDGRAQQHVVVSPHESQHPVFQLLGFHLAMRHAYFHIRNQPVQDFLDGGKFLHLVMQEEHLSAAVELVIDDALDLLLVEQDDFRLDRDTVGRRRLDDGQVTRTQQGELQGTGDRGSRQGKRIHGMLDLAELFLRRNAELLLLVDDQEAEVLELEPVAQDLMRADEDVDGTLFQTLLYISDLLGRTQTAYIFYIAGQVLQTGLEGLEVLQGKDGGRNQHRHLLGIAHRLESRADGDFRLAEADVAAHQAVHGAAFLHVLLDGFGRPLLIRRILIHERRFQFFLQIGVGGERKARGRTTLGVQLDQFLRDILHPRLGGRFEVAPGLRAQLVDARRLPFLGTEAGNLMQGVHGDEHHVTAVVHQFHHLMHPAEVVLHLHQAAEDTHAVVDVHHIISQVEGAEVVQGKLLALFHGTADAHTVETVEDFMVGVPAYLVFMVDEAGMDVLLLYELRKDGILILQHDGTETLQLAFLLSIYIYLVSVFHLGADIRKEQFEALVENRLRGDVELHGRHIFSLQGDIQIDMLEAEGLLEEILPLIHIRGVQPDGGILREEFQQALALFFIGLLRGDVRVNIGLFHLLYGELRVAVEGVDFLYLVSEEADSVGIFLRVGEDVDDGAAEGELAGRAHEVHLLEAFLDEARAQHVVRKAVPLLDAEQRPRKFLGRWNLLLQRLGVGDDEQDAALVIEQLADGGRTLHAQGRLVIASLDALAGFGEIEDAVAFHHII